MSNYDYIGQINVEINVYKSYEIFKGNIYLVKELA